jgi:hypothetical protein
VASGADAAVHSSIGRGAGEAAGGPAHYNSKKNQNFLDGFKFQMVKRWSSCALKFHIKYGHVGN